MTENNRWPELLNQFELPPEQTQQLAQTLIALIMPFEDMMRRKQMAAHQQQQEQQQQAPHQPTPTSEQPSRSASAAPANDLNGASGEWHPTTHVPALTRKHSAHAPVIEPDNGPRGRG